MDALVIVDVQNDFCTGGALAAPKGDEVVPVINKIIGKFEVVVASKDWHPGDTVHFDKWPVHCVKNSKGSEFHRDLMHNEIDQVFLKGTEEKDDGYSAFEATNVNLEKYLKEREVDRVYISGLTTEYCVKDTALSSVRAGFDTYVIEDAIRPVNMDPDDGDKAIREMHDAGCHIVNTVNLN